MTWVIGMSHCPIGGGFIAADTRITVKTTTGTTYYEAVQKIHPLAWRVLGGFSGSVLLGFAAVRMAQRRWRDTLEQRQLVAPSEVARYLGRDLRHAWEQEQGDFDSNHKRHGLSLLLVGENPLPRPPTHPTVMPWNPSDAFILRSPKFEPHELPHGEPRSIGSGSNIEEYRGALSEWLADQGRTSPFLGLVAALAGARMSTHEARPEETISESLQIIRLDAEADDWGEFVEPSDVRIARNAQDYKDLAHAERFNAVDAVGSG